MTERYEASILWTFYSLFFFIKHIFFRWQSFLNIISLTKLVWIFFVAKWHPIIFLLTYIYSLNVKSRYSLLFSFFFPSSFYLIKAKRPRQHTRSNHLKAQHRTTDKTLRAQNRTVGPRGKEMSAAFIAIPQHPFRFDYHRRTTQRCPKPHRSS